MCDCGAREPGGTLAWAAEPLQVRRLALGHRGPCALHACNPFGFRSFYAFLCVCVCVCLCVCIQAQQGQVSKEVLEREKNKLNKMEKELVTLQVCVWVCVGVSRGPLTGSSQLQNRVFSRSSGAQVEEQCTAGCSVDVRRHVFVCVRCQDDFNTTATAVGNVLGFLGFGMGGSDKAKKAAAAEAAKAAKAKADAAAAAR